MELDHDLHFVADGFSDFFEWFDRPLHLFRADEQAVILLRRWIERPNFHRANSALQQAFGKRVGTIHKAVEVFVGTFALAKAPVRHRPDIGGADVFVTRAGVVDALLVAAQTAEHLMHRLVAGLAEQVPPRNYDRGSGAIFDPGRGLRHR